MCWFTSRSSNLFSIVLGMIVLNAQLKSRHSILTYFSECSRWDRAVCSAVLMPSSIDLFALYANWCLSRVGGSAALMCLKTSFSKHFITVGMRATGLRSFKLLIDVFLGMGTVFGTVHRDRERLKILLNTSASWSAQSLSALPDNNNKLPWQMRGPASHCDVHHTQLSSVCRGRLYTTGCVCVFPPPLFLLELLVLSARCDVRPVSWITSSGIPVWS